MISMFKYEFLVIEQNTELLNRSVKIAQRFICNMQFVYATNQR